MADALLSDADVGLAPSSAPSAAPAPAADPSVAPAPSSGPADAQAATAPGALTIHPSPAAAPAVMSDADVGLAPADATAAAAQGQGPLGNTADDGWLSGAAKGTATGVIKGLAHIPGWVGDVNDLSTFLAAGAASLFDSRSASDIYKDMKAKDAALPAALRSPGSVLPSSSDVAAPILAKTGSYQPTSELGTLAQAGVEAAAGGLGPGAGGLTKGATLGSAILSTVKQAPLNAVAGIAGQGATDTTSNPYIGLAASLIAPSATEAAGKVGAKVMSPAIEDAPLIGRAFPNQREINVGNDLLHASSDPVALSSFARSGTAPGLVADALPGPSPTTGAVLGDAGLLNAQRTALRDPNAGMLQHAEGQNAAQVAGLKSVASDDADDMLPSRFLADRGAAIDQAGAAAQQRILQHAQDLAAQLGPGQGAEVNGAAVRSALDAIDATSSASDAANVGQAQSAAAALGPGTAPELNGATLRAAQEAAKEQARQLRSNLYAPETLDPEGKINLVMTPAKDVGKAVSDDIDPLGAPPGADVARILGQVNALPEVLPYKSAMALDQNITAAMAKERRANGESPDWMRLSKLKSGVMGTVNDALDNQHAYEQSAVATGRMNPSDTTMSRLQDEFGFPGDDVHSAQAAGVGDPSGRAPPGDVGVEAGLRGTDAATPRGLGAPSGGQGEASGTGGGQGQVDPDLEARVFHQSVPADPSHSVVPIDVDKVDALTGWQPEYRIAPGSGGKLDRAQTFIQGLGEGQQFRPPQLGVHDQGMGFDDGRNRFAAMRDLGFKTAPVSMDPASEASARRLGLVNEAPAKPATDGRFSAPAYDPDADLFRAPQRPSVGRPQSLHDFVRTSGGMTDPGGDLASMGLQKLIGKDGAVDPDKMREAAAEAGYLGGDTARATRETTPPDLFNALEDGHRTFSVHDDDALLAWDQHDAARAAYDQQRGGDPALRVAGPRPKAPLSSYGEDDIYPPGTAPAPPGAANGALMPSVDDGFAARLKVAKAAHAEYAQTFKQGPVAEDLRTNGFSGQYRTGSGALAGKLLPNGPGGYDVMRARLKAVGSDPVALAALHDQATVPLRSQLDDGILPQSAIDAWRLKHDGALRALDEATPGFSRRFDAAGAAHSAVMEARAAGAGGVTDRYAGTPAQTITRAIKSGPEGYERLKTLLDATGRDPGVIGAVRDQIVDPLRRGLLHDGTVAPRAHAAWADSFGPALRALDEVSPGFSKGVGDAAAATDILTRAGAVRQRAMEEFQASAASKLIGKTDPIEAQNEIMGMVRDGKNGPTKLRQLMDTMKDSPDAQEGVRKLTRDALLREMRNTSESGTSGDAKVSNDKMAKLLRDRRPALEAIFPPDGVNRLGMVARSLELNNRDVTAGTIKASAADRARDISHALGDKLSHSSAAHAGIGAVLGEQLLEHMHNPAVLASAGAGAAALYGLNKLRSGGQRVQDVMYHDAIKNPLLAQRYVTRALDAKDGDANARVLAGIVRRQLIAAPIVKQAYGR